MAESSAPGTLYSSLAGTIIAATMRRSSRWVEVNLKASDMAVSVKEVGKAVLHLVGDVEGDRLGGRGRVDAAPRHEHAAVDDEEILHVVRTAPFVDDRTRRIGSHPRGAEQMPAAPRDRIVDADVSGAGDFKDLTAARQTVVHHLPAVGADRIINLRRGDAVAVLQHWIERDAVMLLGQILADRRDREAVTIEFAEHAVMIGTPRQNTLLLAGHGFEHRPGAAAELDAVATDETARQIGVVEFLAPQAGRRRAVAIGRLLHEPVDLRIWVEHQVLADQAG